MYVDHLTIVADRDEDIMATKHLLVRRFRMKYLGQLSFLLGIGAHQDRVASTVAIHQKQYMLKLLSRYETTNAGPVSTPADVIVKLVKDYGVSKPADQELYQ